MSSLSIRRIALAAMFMFMLGTTTTNGADYYVRASGSDSNKGNSAKAAFQTIKQALSVIALGDTIYLGAGVYSQSTYFDGTKLGSGSSKAKTLRVIGDISGTHTGDKGEIILSAPINAWALQIVNVPTLNLSNITFEGNGASGNIYGCYFANKAGTLNVTACNFRELVYGVYTDTSVAVLKSTFANVLLGTYAVNSKSASITSSTFYNVRYGTHFTDVATGTVSACLFDAAKGKTGTWLPQDPVRAYRSGIAIDDCSMNSPSMGVYGTDFKSFSMKSCSIADPQSWGVYTIGESLSLQSCKIYSTTTRIGQGVMLGDNTGKKSPLSDLTLDGLNQAVVAQYGEYDYQGVSVTNCTIGLYFYPGNPSMDLDSSSKIELKNNAYAVYAVSDKAKPGKLTLRNLDLQGNDYGLLCYYADLSISDCNFSENGYGALIYQCSSADLRNSTFSNNRRGKFSNYGAYVDAERVAVQDCDFSNNQVGLQVVNSATSKAEPNLRNLTITDNTYMGLRVAGGNWTWNAKNNITIRNSQFGVYAERLTWTIDGLELADVGNYGLTDVGGNLTVRNTTVSGGHVGVYSANALSINVENSTVSGALYNGVQVINCKQIAIDGLTANSNGSSGLYCYTLADYTLKLANSAFADNKAAGIRLDGLTLDSLISANLSITGNAYGLMVLNKNLTLNPDMKITFEKNQYAAMCYYGKMTIKDFDLHGENTTGLYQYLGSLEIDGGNLSATNYAVLSYPTGDVSIRNATFHDSRIGVYVAPYKESGQRLTISDCLFNNNSYIGIYASTHSDSKPNLTVEQTEVGGSTYGIYGYYANLNVLNTTINNCGSHAIAQVYGRGNYEGIKINSTKSWGVLAYGDKFEMAQSTITGSQYGMLLSALDNRVINSVIQGGTYGIYANNTSGKVEILQSTIANISHYGVWHEDGTTVLRNSIVKSNYVGLWNRQRKGSFQHDHNLVFAPQPYVNEEPGDSEIQKDPVFRDLKSGDLHLAAGSPAINSGADLSLVSLSDLEGNKRPSFRQFEMGAYEYTDANGSLRVLNWNEEAQ